MKSQLYDIYFIFETDANILIAQLNKEATNLPEALIIKWLAQIKLFDFDVYYIFELKHIAANELSQRPGITTRKKSKTNIDKFIASKLECLCIR